MKKCKIKKLIVVILMVVFLHGMAVLALDEWPMFHHDLALLGYSTSPAPDTNDILWIYDTNSTVSSSPAIADGILYVGAVDSNLYAIDALDGSLVWTFNTSGPIYSSPAVADGNVYFLSDFPDGNLYSLDAQTGAMNWNQPLGSGPWDWSSPAINDGNVFIGSSNGNINSLDADTGAYNWTTYIGGSPDSPIAVVNAKVYSGTHNFNNNSPTLVALDESSGAIVWTYDYYLYHGGVVGMVNSNGVAVADGDNDGDLEVYFGVYNWSGVGDQAVCLEEANGVEVWTTSINGNSTSTPAVHDGRVFIGSDDANVYALDAETGAYDWSFQTGGQVWAAPAVADGKVFVGSWDHTFYALDEITGALIWSYYTGASRLMSSPGVAYGNVYVGNENGNIYAFGQPVWLVNVDIKPQSCPNPLNVKGKGVLPVAILGSTTLDVMDIDVASIRLEGVAAIRSNYEDVATPVLDGEECECTTEGPDGYPDLTLKFNTQEIVDAIGQVGDGDVLSLLLTGNLRGIEIPIEGTDCIRIIKKGHGN